MFDLLKGGIGLLALYVTIKWLYVVMKSGRGNCSYSLFQVCLNLHNKVQCFESALQPVTVSVGAFTIVQLALGLKVHVVYNEAMAGRVGVHFIALAHQSKQGIGVSPSLSVNSSRNKWCSPEYYLVELCLAVLVSCTPPLGLGETNSMAFINRM